MNVYGRIQQVIAAIAAHPYPPEWWYEKHSKDYHKVHLQCGWCGMVKIHHCKKDKGI